MKARVVQMRAGGIAAARVHLDYIERDGVERDGSPGRLYSANSGDIRESLAEALPGERHQFRFIVSPEDGHELDLTAFTRDLMTQIERDTGRRLIWGAVNHHDTDNPHVHVVLRGVDVSGQEVWLERTYISERIRWQAQHLVTRELGARTELDLSRQLSREIRQERFTTVDRKLAQLLSPSKGIDLRRLALTTDGLHRARVRARLAVLEQLGLAERPSPSSWQLKENWQEALQALGRRGDIIKRIHSALGGQGDPSRYAVIDGTAEHPPIEGIVRRKGLHDERRGDVYAVVETPEGRAHYLRLDRPAAEGLREGSVVRLDALAQKGQATARYRTKITVLTPDPAREVRCVGPTWLDAQGDGAPRAPYGFGAQLSAAERGRAAFLEELGVRGSPGDVRKELQKREPAALGAKLAVEAGCAFVAEPPAGFRGRAFACVRTPSGAEFVRVVDETNRRLALVPANTIARTFEGQLIELGRDPKGRVVVRSLGLSRGD
jgi:type IV secretory pathway VirD2 relaxase